MTSSGKTGGWSAATLATPRGRGNTISGVTVRAKLVTEPLSTQSAGTRKAVHGGAGDGGGTGAASKQPGRRQVKNTPPAQLVHSTITSSLRAKQQRDQAAQGKSQASSLPSTSTEAEVKKTTKQRVMTQAAKQAARARLWPNRQPAGGKVSSNQRKEMPSTGVSERTAQEEFEMLLAEEARAKEEEAKAHELLETGIQTNEAEILDHRLLLGYVKMVSPSTQLVQQIDRERREQKARNDRIAARRFAIHEQDEELHLDELREFSDRNAVTKRAPKKLPPISYATYDNQYQNVFKSMDEFFSREVPKSEPVANIQERIKRKEQELLSLFDGVEGK